MLAPSEVYASKLNLNDVLNSVDQHYPLMIAARRDIEKTQGDLLSAQGGFDPVLKANSINTPVGYYNYNYLDTTLEQPTPLWGSKVYGGWRTGQGNFPVYDGRLSTFTGGELRGGIEVPILRNGTIDERRAKIQSYEKSVEIANASMSLQRLEATRQATHYYWEWVAAGRKLAIAHDMLDMAEVRDKGLLQRLKHGDVPLIEQTENQRAVVQRKSSVIAAERALQKSTLELSLFFRNSEGVPILVERSLLPTSFPEPVEMEDVQSDQDDQIQSVLIRHPELKRIHFQMDQTQIDVRFAQNQILPRLDFQFGASLDLGSPPSPTLSSAYMLPPYNTELKIGVLLEIPLFFRTARGKLEATRATYSRMDAQASLTRDRIKMNLINSLQAIKTSQKRVTLARQELELARKLEDGERTRFLHGDSTLLIVNIREQATGDAAIREVDALLEYYRAKADYQTSLAQ